MEDAPSPYRASTSNAGVRRSRNVALDRYYEVKAEICVSALTVPPPYADAPRSAPPPLVHLLEDDSMDMDEGDFAFTSIEYNDHGEILSRFPLAAVQLECPMRMRVRPQPKYEAVAPTLDSIQAEHNDDTCPFLIYADDPQFEHGSFAAVFDLHAWDMYTQPMELRVAEETAKRLHEENGMDYTAINQSGVMAPFVIHIDQVGGGIFLRHEFDLHPSRYWRNLPGDPPSDEDGLFDDLKGMPTTFCALCMSFCCTLHRASRNELMKRNPPLAATLPKVLRSKLKSYDATLRVHGRSRMCGTECWMHPDVDSYAPLHDIPAESERRLKALIDYAPDEAPCALAVLADLPCSLIYRYRDSQISDADIKRYAAQSKRRDKNRDEGERTVRIANRPPYMSVSHTCRGRCIDNDSCECFTAEHPRECDPQRCKSCGASALATDPDRCGNVQLQAQRVAALEVRPSKYGLGAYALHAVRQRQVIGDYNGEICSPRYMHNMNLREGFAPSYIFEFERYEKAAVIEGATAGNATRYINHAPNEGGPSILPVEYVDGDPGRPIHANCDAQETVVDGDLRMVIYARRDIERGEELRLDYGRHYWENHLQGHAHAEGEMIVDEDDSPERTADENSMPTRPKSRTRRKPGSGRDSRYDTWADE
ncbi:hypothetical protein HDZ31DRAFT_35882 [Schizophyllum fasciatum]